ncbi:hypothetical protein C0Q70_10917 [Pomacea canaliculata]|uniref:NACHT domain-containing protein n=1 Tax=Pomacea canaliculata TaxID=400727 RepID=A0A2T7P4J3_POMCA|nr:hypothetical protein C0Q70_10917 [Pomacea canaliculata]
MYRRQYKTVIEVRQKKVQPDLKAKVTDEQPTDSDVQKQVAQIWETIKQICQKGPAEFIKKRAQEQKNKSVATSEWKTVRIFVSSTFNDFFSEREVLVKKVFPELREWCHDMKLKLIECDLRWGVPKDATSTQALLTCLEEIDRCYESNGQPFFLNLMGTRYGWIPTVNDIPKEVHEKYDWVDGISITSMEILHGALRISNPNAAFFLRDPSFLKDLPPDYLKIFDETSMLAREHLQHFPNQTFHYKASYGGTQLATGRAMVQLTDLDEFASQVTEFFKKAIATAYPQEERSNQLTPEEKETELQWLYIEDKAETLIGRDRELRMLLDYAQQTPELNLEQIDGSDNPSIRETSQWDLEENDNQLCFVVAEGGWGKTALLARLVHQACEDGHNVFYHFVGSTASSRSHDNLLQRLIMALAEDPADRRLSDPEATTDTLKGHLRTVLSSCRHKGKKMLLVFDGLNELDNNETVQHLSWLPPALPPNLRCVVSANMAHSPTIARLHEHPAVQVTLGALDRGALMELASNYLERFGKKLDLTQLQTLVDISKVNNPQWMMWMCEELRIFGDFRMMDKKLSEMPDTMEDFLQLLLKRLLYEDDTGCIKKTLCLTACSQRGLPSDHILQILGEINDKRECPQLHWAQARRILKPYIRTIQDSTHAEEFITFNHETMWKAVRRSFLEQEETTQWHKQLADFYEFWCKKEELRTNDLPFHLLKAGLRKRKYAALAFPTLTWLAQKKFDFATSVRSKVGLFTQA